MKKITILLTILTLIGLLAACGSSDDQASVTNEGINASQKESAPASDTTQAGTPPEEFEVPLQTALIVGSFELESTDDEITSEQAAELLPLWIVLKNLLDSDTAAGEEINALTNQIADTMTEDQMNQINNLELTPQSIGTLIQELGLNEGFQRPESADGEGERPEGMGPGTGTGMGMGMGPGGGQGETGLSPEQLESFRATREASGETFGSRMGMMGNTALIDALIELLQNK